MNNLAALYETTGRYGEAEPLYTRALEASERVLGPEHPDTLGSVNNLAFLHQTSPGAMGRPSRFTHARSRQASGCWGRSIPRRSISVNNLAASLRGTTGRYGEAEPLFKRTCLRPASGCWGRSIPDTLSTLGNLSRFADDQGGDAVPPLRGLRQIDQRLNTWLRTEVSTARAAAMRRQMLQLNSIYQDGSFSLALQHPSAAGNRFAADLTLRWKKRLAQEDTILNNLLRETDDSALRDLIRAVQTGRQTLSNMAFNPDIGAEEKTRALQALEADEVSALRAASEKFRRHQEGSRANADEVMLALPRASALIEYRIYQPLRF